MEDGWARVEIKILTMEIIAILLSPIIASIISLWVGEKMRKKDRKKDEEYDICKKLIAYRYQLHSVEFLSALNSIVLVFHRDKDLKEMVKNLHHAYTNGENQKIIDQKIVELIYRVCKIAGYDVEEYEIVNLFQPIATMQTSSPSFTANNSTYSENIKSSEINNSVSVGGSITSGNL